MFLRLSFVGLSLAILTFTACGDGKPARFPVTGVVTLDDKPVEGAQISFVPDGAGGVAATATSDASGKYQLTTYSANDGAIPASYKIKVVKFPITPQADSPPAGYDSGGEDPSNMSLEDQYAAAGNYGGPPADAKKRKGPQNELPSKYEDAQSSGLVFTVEATDNVFDLKLTK